MNPKTVTDDVREKIAETKSSQSVAKILKQASEFPTTQSNAGLAVPGHRFHKHITLDEYKALLASGKTVLQICETTS